MRRLSLIAIVSCLAACGGGGSAEPASGSGSGEGSSGSETTGAGEAGAEGSSGSGSAEFQLQDSDTADQAHGERPSQIESSRTHAALRLFVVHPDEGPIPGIVIKLTGPDGTSYYTGETDSHGYAEVLVPIAQRYELEYLSLGREVTTANVEVPDGPRQDIRLTLRYRRWRRPTPPPPPPAPSSDDEDPPPPAEPEQPSGFVLDGVTFASNSADIEDESLPRLQRVVEYLQHRPSVRIRISGHTDNVGRRRRNQRLSEQRANAVRDYLISQGIDGSRIEAVGYGDQRPVASNDTEEGRQQNRRIEAIEL